MSGQSERLQPGVEQGGGGGVHTAQWAALLALLGALAFGSLLVWFGVVVYRAWPQMTGTAAAVSKLADKVDRLGEGHAAVAGEVAALRKELAESRTADEVARLRARVAELADGVTATRARADQAAAEGRAREDAVVRDLRGKLEALGAKVDQLAAAGRPVEADRVKTPVAEASPPGFSADEVERELRDMRETIVRCREEARMAPAVRLPVLPAR
jgi:outer membrane murein-binding lipoprotein Lpp